MTPTHVFSGAPSRNSLWQIALFAFLGLLLAVPALGHEGHQHAPPPKPKTPKDRLIGVFVGQVPDKMPVAKAIRITREVAGGGGKRLRLDTLYTPTHYLIGRVVPLRYQLADAATGEPLAGYAPKLVLTFPSGAVSRGTMAEVAGYPGLYEYWASLKEPGACEVSVSIGSGPSAPLPEHTETIYSKRPDVPWISYLVVGVLITLGLAAIGVTAMHGRSRPVAFAIAAVIGVGVPILVRAPIAAQAHALRAAETAMLANEEVEEGVAWPDPIITAPKPIGAPAAATEPSGALPLPAPLGVTIRGTLRTPDDARAVVSASQTGVFTTSRILARGTVVKKGQSLGSIRVLNEEIAPEAASAPSAIADAEAAVVAAEVVLAQARKDLERAQQLSLIGAISERELESAEQDVTLAENSLAAARKQLTVAEERSDVLNLLGGTSAYRTVALSSPLDGVVVEVGVAAGQAVVEGDLIYTIVDPSRLWLEAHLFEDQVGAFSPGTRVEFITALDPTTPRAATLRHLGHAFDPESRTLPALFDVEPPLTGLFAEQTVSLLPPQEAGDA